MREDGQKMKTEGPRYEISILSKILPQIEGAKQITWEIQNLSNSESGIPGPGDYRFKGIVLLDEFAAKEYKDNFEWKEISVNIEADTFDLTKYNQKKWYYSLEFQQQIASKRVMGKIYFSGEELWFNIVYS